MISAPGAGNENLRAQEGAFTLWRPVVDDWSIPFEPEEGLEDVIGAMPSGDAFYTLLHKFMLAPEHAGLLLYLLNCEGISASSVLPGYAGVAKEVRELYEARGTR